MSEFTINLLTIAAGLVVLTVGAESLVRGAAGLAAAVRVSPLVIGLTVVAFGTSAPEFAVSLKAAVVGQADLAVGNVVGSNIFNVLFILGLSAWLVPLVVSAQLIRLEVPLMILSALLMWGLALDGRLNRIEGGILFTGLLAYTAWSILQSRREKRAIQEEYQQEFGMPERVRLGKAFKLVALVLVGLALLVLGAGWLVDGSVGIARGLGVSELLIGLTIVAAGTSLPELATSVMASLRGERDIAVGNVVGSNLFNVLGVLGLSALVSPMPISISAAAMRVDIPIMIGVSIACLPIFFTGHLIARWEGALFFCFYLAYMAHAVLAATGVAAADTFGMIMLIFVLPLTAITLLTGVYRSLRARAAV